MLVVDKVLKCYYHLCITSSVCLPTYHIYYTLLKYFRDYYHPIQFAGGITL